MQMQIDWHESCSFPLSLWETSMRSDLMQALATPLPLGSDEAEQVTLLELVRAVSEVTEDDREVVATVRHLLQSGRVRLCGNFRNASPKEFS